MLHIYIYDISHLRVKVLVFRVLFCDVQDQFYITPTLHDARLQSYLIHKSNLYCFQLPPTATIEVLLENLARGHSVAFMYINKMKFHMYSV